MRRIFFVFAAIASLGVAPACNFDFGPDADRPKQTKSDAKEFYDRVPQEPASAPRLPTS